MNREQVKQELLKGRVLEELFEFRSGQGCDIYKGEFSLSDEIIYILALDLNEIPIHEAVEKEEVDWVINAMYSGLVLPCGNFDEFSTRYLRQCRVVVSQRCHRIVSFLRLALTQISGTDIHRYFRKAVLDFLEQCSGKEELAKELFWYCDWQHPSSAWYGDFLWDMEE